jgi:tRNA dimethylallyltransferase
LADWPPLLVLAGPTAVGKTELALEVCRALGGEVIMADSAAVYRGLDIGTAKPTPEQRARVPHHLLDLRDPRETFSVAEYRVLAEAAILGCAARGRVPVLVGGTGLYIRQVLEAPALPPVPPQPELRAALATRPAEELYAELRRVDPEAAARIHPANVRRVIRALEVWHVTGRPISEAWRRSRAAGGAGRRELACLVVLDRPQPVLRQRIEARVAEMLRAGLVDEVQGLLAAGVPPGAQSLQALGYRQTVAWLGSGQPLAALREAIVRATVQYAKRQRTWFRREAEARWLQLGDLPAARALPEVLRVWEGHLAEAAAARGPAGVQPSTPRA